MTAVPMLRGTAGPWEVDALDGDRRPAARGPLHVDVAIVGGGLGGLSAAYHLAGARPDLEIVVLESHQVGGGATGRSTGILRPGVGGTILELAKGHGEELAARLYRASIAAVDHVRSIVTEEGISCSLEDLPHVKIARTGHQERLLEREARMLSRLSLGVQVLDAAGLADRVPVPARVGLAYPQSAQLDPLKLCRGLAAAAERRGVRIFEESQIVSVTPGHRLTLGLATGGTVKAGQVVLATDGYLPSLGILPGRIVPMQTHVLVTAPIREDRLRELRWSGRQSFSDKRHVFDYCRLTSDNRIVFGGGRPLYGRSHGAYGSGRIDAASGHTMRRQRAAFRRAFPGLDRVAVAGQWSGTLGMTLDRLPVVGTPEDLPGVLAVGGWNGHGVAMATASGGVVAALLSDQPSAWAGLPLLRASAPWLPPDPLRAVGLAAYLSALQLADSVDGLSARVRVTHIPSGTVRDARGAVVPHQVPGALAADPVPGTVVIKEHRA